MTVQERLCEPGDNFVWSLSVFGDIFCMDTDVRVRDMNEFLMGLEFGQIYKNFGLVRGGFKKQAKSMKLIFRIVGVQYKEARKIGDRRVNRHERGDWGGEDYGSSA